MVLIWLVIGKSVNNIPRSESSMNQKLKQAGLFAILAVFTISLTTSFVGDAEASPQSRGDVTSEPTEPSIKAKNRAAATPEPEPETPRSESNPTRPAGGPVEPSSKAKQSAEALEKATPEEVQPFLQQIAVHDPSTRADRNFTVTGDVTTFTVVYSIENPSNIDLRNVEISVTSDKESVSAVMSGNYDKDHRTISVMIDAVDPASVNAEIVGFDI